MRVRFQTCCSFLLLVAAIAGFAGPASGLSMVPDSVSPVGGSASQMVRLVGDTTGTPTGATVLFGSIDPNDVTLIFQIEDLGFLPIDFHLPGVGVAGFGVIEGTGDYGLQKPSFLTTPTFQAVTFPPPPGSSDWLFISYEGPVEGETIFISILGGPGTPALLVPEPGWPMFALVAVSAIVQRRRRGPASALALRRL